jgi:hypothetical protein
VGATGPQGPPGPGSELVAGTVSGGYPVLSSGVVRALKARAPLLIDPDDTNLEIRLDQNQLDATSQITALQTSLGTKQATLTQPGIGTELLYDSSKLKRLAFGSGLTGGTDAQPDGSQTISISVRSNLPVSTLTPPASTPLAVAGALQVSGLTKVGSLEAAGVVIDDVLLVGNGHPTPCLMFPGSLALGKWRIRVTSPGPSFWSGSTMTARSRPTAGERSLPLGTTRTRMSTGSASTI